jgi:succinate dehydrogenase/fumarate reductase flavoprotein subunit
MPQTDINRITRWARQEHLGTEGSFATAGPVGPITCNNVVALVVTGAVTALATGWGVVTAHNYIGHNNLSETLVDGSRTGHGSLSQLIDARSSVELAS